LYYYVNNIDRLVLTLVLMGVDELDKMPRRFQEHLLNFMKSGRIKVVQQKKQYHLTTIPWSH